MPKAPWDFSEPPAEGEGVPNTPTPMGRALGAELARLCDAEEARVREQFPGHGRRCNDCAFRAGTDPNGCVETLMDAVKGLVECIPFYCHKQFDEDGRPTRLCAGWSIFMGAEGPPAGLAAVIAPLAVVLSEQVDDKTEGDRG